MYFYYYFGFDLLIGALFCLVGLGQAKFNYKDFSKSWQCSAKARAHFDETNFPPEFRNPLNDKAFTETDRWTTNHVKYRANERHELSYSGYKLSRNWTRSQDFGFRLKPYNSSKIVVQLFNDLNNPFVRQGTNQSQTDFLTETFKQDPYLHSLYFYKSFNCFIVRNNFKVKAVDLNQTLEDLCQVRDGQCVSESHNKDCKWTNMGPIAYLTAVKNIDKFYPCARGSKDVQCCYAALEWLPTSESLKQIVLDRLKSVYKLGNRFGECSKRLHHEKWPQNVNEACQIPHQPSCETDMELIRHSDPKCNPFLYKTVDSCLEQHWDEMVMRPCHARCLQALVLNLEIVPKSGKKKGKVRLSVVYNYKVLDQTHYHGPQRNLEQRYSSVLQSKPFKMRTTFMFKK